MFYTKSLYWIQIETTFEMWTKFCSRKNKNVIIPVWWVDRIGSSDNYSMTVRVLNYYFAVLNTYSFCQRDRRRERETDRERERPLLEQTTSSWHIESYFKVWHELNGNKYFENKSEKKRRKSTTCWADKRCHSVCLKKELALSLSSFHFLAIIICCAMCVYIVLLNIFVFLFFWRITNE